jgi:hypothetical protein
MTLYSSFLTVTSGMSLFGSPVTLMNRENARLLLVATAMLVSGCSSKPQSYTDQKPLPVASTPVPQEVVEPVCTKGSFGNMATIEMEALAKKLQKINLSKDEYETQQAYKQRIEREKQVINFPVDGIYFIKSSLNSEHMRYNADTQELEVKRWALSNAGPNRYGGYPRKAGQLEDGHRDLKCRKARPQRLRIQKLEALMLQSVPPYVDTRYGLFSLTSNLANADIKYPPATLYDLEQFTPVEKEQGKGSYVGSNAFGATERVAKIERQLYGVLEVTPFVSEKYGDIDKELFSLKISPEEAKRFKREGQAIIKMKVQWPYYITSRDHFSPTISAPIERDTTYHYALGDIQCVAAYSPSKGILGIKEIH